MASMAAFVYFWSSAYEVSGGCATDTLYPSFLRMLATGSQPDPSANAPCTRTTFLIGFVTTILLRSKDPLGSVDFSMSKAFALTAHVVRRIGDLFALGPLCRGDALAQVDEVGFRNVNAEGADCGVYGR